MYAETYPDLKAKYDVENFEIIADVIEKNFSDIFKLDVLDSEAKAGVPERGYAKLFHTCMDKLGDLFTPDEVINKLCEERRKKYAR